MKGKYITIILVAVALLLGSFNLAAGDSDKNKKKCQLELYGGIGAINPEHLNYQAQIYNAGIKFETADYFAYLDQALGNAFTSTGSIVNEFEELKLAFLLGGRIKYRVNSWLAVSAGLQYLRGKRVSSSLGIFHNRMVLPDNVSKVDDYTDSNHFTDFTLTAEAFAPMVGIHVYLLKDYVEGFITGGPLFAKASYSFIREYRQEYDETYWSGSDSDGQATGNGTGLALEAGARINVPICKSLTVFLEGSYAHMKTSNLSGEMTTHETTLDINHTRDTITNTREGDWKVSEVDVQAPWGNLKGHQPTLLEDGRQQGDGISDFELDLSGFRLKVGLAFRF